jgi:glyoxylase-like metal-dependent hydrolase (beta-lactamase superfamily II)
VTAQPVGVSSFAVGDIRLTHLPDGYHRCDPLPTFAGSTQSDWDEHRHLLDEQGRVVMTMGAILAELPDRQRMLIDLAFGPRTMILEGLAMEFWGGRLVRSLATIGLQPADIDVVCYSHMHIDHVGWTADVAGALTFSRARHVVARAELEYWLSSDELGGPDERERAALEPRVDLVDGEVTVAPGVRMIPTPGHTPGHCSFLIESGGERAVVLGDAIHCPLQITHPEWEFSSDVNPAAAIRAREHLLRELDAPETTVVGAHFADAVFGRVLSGTVARQVAFDVAPPAPPQALADDAPPGAVFLPPLD